MEDTLLGDTLQSFLQEQVTCPRLAYTLLEALHSDIDDSRYPQFKNRHGANDPNYRKLHQLQAYVGWSQLFQGRLVKEWSQLQEAFLENLPPNLQPDRKYYTGDIWARKLVTLLWGIIRAQWDHRNADRHGRTKEENRAIRHARLMGQVTEQYAQGGSMLATDRDIIAEPIHLKAKRSPAALELWLDSNIPVVKLSTAAATAAIVKTHKKITSFFRKVRPPELPGEHHPNEKDPEKPGPVYTA